MLKEIYFLLIAGLFALFFTTASNAESLIKKEVYSFKDKSGNLVFTDKRPIKQKNFKTQTIEAANFTGNVQSKGAAKSSYKQRVYADNTNNTIKSPRTVKLVVEDRKVVDKKSYKKKRRLKRCKAYKKKFTYYSAKMRSGYKSSEYEKLESKRKKYRKLLFNNCDTKTFDD